MTEERGSEEKLKIIADDTAVPRGPVGLPCKALSLITRIGHIIRFIVRKVKKARGG